MAAVTASIAGDFLNHFKPLCDMLEQLKDRVERFDTALRESQTSTSARFANVEKNSLRRLAELDSLVKSELKNVHEVVQQKVAKDQLQKMSDDMASRFAAVEAAQQGQSEDLKGFCANTQCEISGLQAMIDQKTDLEQFLHFSCAVEKDVAESKQKIEDYICATNFEEFKVSYTNRLSDIARQVTIAKDLTDGIGIRIAHVEESQSKQPDVSTLNELRRSVQEVSALIDNSFARKDSLAELAKRGHNLERDVADVKRALQTKISENALEEFRGVCNLRFACVDNDVKTLNDTQEHVESSLSRCFETVDRIPLLQSEIEQVTQMIGQKANSARVDQVEEHFSSQFSELHRAMLDDAQRASSIKKDMLQQHARDGKVHRQMLEDFKKTCEVRMARIEKSIGDIITPQIRSIEQTVSSHLCTVKTSAEKHESLNKDTTVLIESVKQEIRDLRVALGEKADAKMLSSIEKKAAGIKQETHDLRASLKEKADATALSSIETKANKIRDVLILIECIKKDSRELRAILEEKADVKAMGHVRDVADSLAARLTESETDLGKLHGLQHVVDAQLSVITRSIEKKVDHEEFLKYQHEVNLLEEKRSKIDQTCLPGSVWEADSNQKPSIAEFDANFLKDANIRSKFEVTMASIDALHHNSNTILERLEKLEASGATGRRQSKLCRTGNSDRALEALLSQKLSIAEFNFKSTHDSKRFEQLEAAMACTKKMLERFEKLEDSVVTRSTQSSLAMISTSDRVLQEALERKLSIADFDAKSADDAKRLDKLEAAIVSSEVHHAKSAILLERLENLEVNLISQSKELAPKSSDLEISERHHKLDASIAKQSIDGGQRRLSICETAKDFADMTKDSQVYCPQQLDTKPSSDGGSAPFAEKSLCSEPVGMLVSSRKSPNCPCSFPKPPSTNNATIPNVVVSFPKRPRTSNVSVESDAAEPSSPSLGFRKRGRPRKHAASSHVGDP